MNPEKTLTTLRDELRKFAQERDWQPFHTPKNLAMALIVEAAELVEHFQWLSPEQSASLDEKTQEEVAQELADIQIYLARLADVLGVDLMEAAYRKLAINAAKYPVETARGSAAKYRPNRL
ncbi:MAG: nucleotide pyrophosphohydrolase [Burkholderiales bacterium]|nr:nucleotide pyrophosphohydrolase [Sulfuricellaceae bacterium]